MKREVDFDAWSTERRHVVLPKIVEMLELPKPVRRRPRSREESAVLEAAAIAWIEKARAEGRIVRLGPRRYELR